MVEEDINFSERYLKGVHTPHRGARLIEATVLNCKVIRVLIDNGITTNILTYNSL